MNKKMLCILGGIILILLIGCGFIFIKQNHINNNDNDKKLVENKKNTIYSFNDGNKLFKLGEIFTTEKYGKPITYSEIPSCAFEGLDKTYTYKHYEIITYPDGNVDRILSIYFLDDYISTSEDVKITDSYDKMIKVYGNNFKNEYNQYTYELGKTQIIFIVENNIITSIEYNYNY